MSVAEVEAFRVFLDRSEGTGWAWADWATGWFGGVPPVTRSEFRVGQANAIMTRAQNDLTGTEETG